MAAQAYPVLCFLKMEETIWRLVKESGLSETSEV